MADLSRTSDFVVLNSHAPRRFPVDALLPSMTTNWPLVRLVSALLTCALAMSAHAQDSASEAAENSNPAALSDPPQTQPEEGELVAPVSEVSRPESGFQFGSYGRVAAASDLRGGAGDDVNVVTFGPRITETPYLELDLAYLIETDSGAQFFTLVTPAIVDALFHYTGEFDGTITLRNAYVEGRNFGVDGLSIWAGSRMYRGDDIYLLNFWPLDNLNTVGGGFKYRFLENTSIAVHGGLNQVEDPFQRQVVQSPRPDFGTEDLLINDRVRPIASLRFEQLLPELAGDIGAKFVAWGEYQFVGDGQYELDDDTTIQLPNDEGYTVGAQIGAWGFTENGFANLFFRYSRGLAAYGELFVPPSVDTDRRARSARLVRLGTSFNAEFAEVIAITGGAYAQWFQDADDGEFDNDDYSEGVFALRPTIFITEHFHQVFEASYQRRSPQGLNERTDTYLEPAVWQFAAMPTLAVGRGAFSRPHIRFIYSLSLLNEGAQTRWPEGDPRAAESTQHYLGVGVEWWFNSFTYR